MKNYIFTSESVTEGHPDKICDQIADAILDEALAQDPDSNMAVEATIKDDFVLVYGEANTKAKIDYEKIALDTIKKIGYDEDYYVTVVVNEQSPEIHNAVNKEEICAGDQGIMFGYACDETPEFMPMPIYYAHQLAMQLAKVRRNNPLLKPDGKTQVSVEYVDDEPKRIDTIVVSTQHDASLSQEEIKKLVMEEVIAPVVDAKWLDENTKYFINPSGSFVVGGSFGDSGTTGRKIVCDTYGGRAEVQVSYAIGKNEPISICVDTFGTGKLSDEKLLEVVEKNFNFNVDNILKELDLRKPIYKKTSCYGHFGDPQFTWEQTKALKTE